MSHRSKLAKAAGLLLSLALGGPLALHAQDPRSQIPPADSADVQTLDGVMRAFYEIVSGPPGAPRQWRRDSTLYYPGHRFAAMDVDDRTGTPVLRVMAHGEFAALTDSTLVPGGFHETEIHRTVQRFGNLAHVFSTYAWRRTPDGPVGGRGINSIQLLWDGTRWWILSTAWDSEREGNPIPRAFGGGR